MTSTDEFIIQIPQIDVEESTTDKVVDIPPLENPLDTSETTSDNNSSLVYSHLWMFFQVLSGAKSTIKDDA